MPIGEGQPNYDSSLELEEATEDDIKPLVSEIDSLVPPGDSDFLDMAPLNPVGGLTGFSINKYTFDDGLIAMTIIMDKPTEAGAIQSESWMVKKLGKNLELNRLIKVATPNGDDESAHMTRSDFARDSFAFQTAMGLARVSKKECADMVKRLKKTHPLY